jgi:hypothetical protein
VKRHRARRVARRLLAGVAALCLSGPVAPRGVAAVETPAGEETDDGSVRLAAPGGGWLLRLDLPGFELSPWRVSEDGTRWIVTGENETSGVEVSVVMEATAEADGAAACREHFARLARRRSRVQRADVRRRREGDAEIVEYLLEGLQDGAFRQKHVNAYLARGGVCADVHLSKERFNWSEAGLFETVLRSVRIEPQPAPLPADRGGGAAAAAPAASPPRVSARRLFPVPGKAWSAVLETFGLVMDGSAPVFAIEPEGRRFREQRVTGRWWTGRRVAAGLALAVFAGESSAGDDAAACRSAIWPRIRLGLPVRLEEVRRGERGAAAWVEYRKPWRQRARIDARVLHLFLARDGVCVSAALERIDPRPADQELFDAFLARAGTGEALPATPP